MTNVSHLPEVSERLHEAGLKLKPSKCTLLQLEVKYLGHVVGWDEVAINLEEVQAARD